MFPVARVHRRRRECAKAICQRLSPDQTLYRAISLDECSKRPKQENSPDSCGRQSRQPNNGERTFEGEPASPCAVALSLDPLHLPTATAADFAPAFQINTDVIHKQRVFDYQHSARASSDDPVATAVDNDAKKRIEQFLEQVSQTPIPTELTTTTRVARGYGWRLSYCCTVLGEYTLGAAHHVFFLYPGGEECSSSSSSAVRFFPQVMAAG